jgi:hypothetical protein
VSPVYTERPHITELPYFREGINFISGLQWGWTSLQAFQPVSKSAFQLSLAEVLTC